MATEGLSDDFIRGRIREQVPGLIALVPDELLENLDCPLKTLLPHGLYQAVIICVEASSPHVERAAFEEGATWRDVEAWLLPDISTKASGRIRRGTYKTTSVGLRPIEPRDLEGIYLASVDPQLNHRWRFRGRTPSLAEFQSFTFADATLAQYMVEQLPGHNTVGVVMAYNADLVAGHAHVALQRTWASNSESQGLMIPGFYLFAQYLFDHFNFRKLYVEIPEYNLDVVAAGLEGLLIEEGCLKDHYFYGERYWSSSTFAIYKSQWDLVVKTLLGDWV